MGFGLKEMLLIGAVLLIFFGSAKLPELGRSLGLGIHEFRRAKKELLGPDAAPTGKK